jgi:hypothetical protein
MDLRIFFISLELFAMEVNAYLIFVFLYSTTKGHLRLQSRVSSFPLPFLIVNNEPHVLELDITHNIATFRL